VKDGLQNRKKGGIRRNERWRDIQRREQGKIARKDRERGNKERLLGYKSKKL
jgi:hypothetical protein